MGMGTGRLTSMGMGTGKADKYGNGNREAHKYGNGNREGSQVVNFSTVEDQSSSSGRAEHEDNGRHLQGIRRR